MTAGAAAGVLLASAVLAAGLLPGASAGVSGYGPVGPDPATDTGLSVPVLRAEVVGGSGGVVTASAGGIQAALAVPGRYAGEATLASLTDLSGPGVAEALVASDVRAGRSVVAGVGVGLRAVEADAGADIAGTAGATGGPLVVTVDGPGLAGALVVVVADGRMTTTEGTAGPLGVTLPGPSAVFVLAPARTPGGEPPAGEPLLGEPPGAATPVVTPVAGPVPVAVPVAVATPGDPAAGVGGDGLARTGPTVWPLIAMAAGLLVLGSAGVVLARRRP